MSYNFGQNTGFSFGSTPVTTSSTSLFGAQTPAFGQTTTAPAFGGSGGSVFGGQPSQQPLFGTQSQSAFGSSAFGSNAAFGATPSAFGVTQTPQPTAPSAFGGFGSMQSTVPSFGSTPAFGSQPTPPTSGAGGLFPFQSPQQQPQQQQSTTSIFGGQTTPASTASVFGSPFGAAVVPQTSQPTSLFGVTPQPTQQPTSQPTLSFGSSPAFGSAMGQSFNTSIAPTAPVSSATSLFGSTPTAPASAPAFGGFGAATGFAAVPATSSAPAFNFGGGVTTATTTTPTLSFSLTQTPSTAAPAFGATPGFGTTTSTTSAVTSTSSFGFGPPIATPSTQSPFNFGSTPTPAITSVQPLGTTASQLGTSAPPLTSTVAPVVPTVSTASSTPSFNFSTPTTTQPFSLTTPSTTPSTTASVAPFGLNLSTPSTTTTASIAPTFSIPSTTTTFPAKTTSFPGSVAQPTTTATSTAVTTVPTIPTTTPTKMTFRQLEDQINLWLNELNQLETEFHIQAQTINSWDSLLINNGLKITQINETLEKLRTDHTRLDHQLDFIIAQQNELEQLLVPIEANKTEMSSNNAVNTEREYTYSLVETVHNDLNGIGNDLKNFIKKLNEMRSTQDSTDPLGQISKILNSHMDALQWIETQIKTIKITTN